MTHPFFCLGCSHDECLQFFCKKEICKKKLRIDKEKINIF